MQATVLLFALAREKAGRPTLTVDLPEPATVADLKAALARACPALAPLLPTLRIAIDSEYAADDRADPARRRTGRDPARQRRLARIEPDP